MSVTHTSHPRVTLLRYVHGLMETILLVEDEPLIASFVSRGLRAEGYMTAVAASGDEAVAELAGRQWDLVVLDLKLPGVDGFGVLARAIEAGQLQL